jgi:hypothetical protein
LRNHWQGSVCDANGHLIEQRDFPGPLISTGATITDPSSGPDVKVQPRRSDSSDKQDDQAVCQDGSGREPCQHRNCRRRSSLLR